MNDRKILVLSTYPISKPQHGGQKRVFAIVEAYSRSFSAVRHCAIFYRGFYNDHGPDDIGLGSWGESRVMRSPLTGDIVCGEAASQDPAVRPRLAALIRDFCPDIIHIEQPFLYIGLRPLLDSLNLAPKLVFGSQNIEAPMKRDMLANLGLPGDEIEDAVAKIGDVEACLTRDSDLVVACTGSDLAAHQRFGARSCVLAPNGASEIVTNRGERERWRQVLFRSGATRTALFVGSAHPPNWTGFLDVIGKGLGFVPNDARLVVAGSICDYFSREIDPDAQDIEDATFWLRALSAGRLAEERLGAIISESDVMVLPITEGGGSNLKTAEAILADKKVVATSHALRSFEWYRDFPNVWVADTKADFQASIVEALGTPRRQRTAQEHRQAAQVGWQYCLKEMVAAVEEL